MIRMHHSSNLLTARYHTHNCSTDILKRLQDNNEEDEGNEHDHAACPDTSGSDIAKTNGRECRYSEIQAVKEGVGEVLICSHTDATKMV